MTCGWWWWWWWWWCRRLRIQSNTGLPWTW